MNTPSARMIEKGISRLGRPINDVQAAIENVGNIEVATEVVENGKVVDKEETRIGIRHIEMSIEKGFVINGKPLRLVGSNRHMEYPYVGNAISDQAQYRDMYQIRSNGFNIVRLGHYPQATAALDACDELGLLAIEPIPGWQFFNKNPLFISLTHRDVRDMIRRDRNHPSIVMWETTLNESWLIIPGYAIGMMQHQVRTPYITQCQCQPDIFSRQCINRRTLPK